jgi:hypothetical protein
MSVTNVSTVKRNRAVQRVAASIAAGCFVDRERIASYWTAQAAVLVDLALEHRDDRLAAVEELTQYYACELATAVDRNPKLWIADAEKTLTLVQRTVGV